MRYFPKTTPRMKKILAVEYQKGYINTSILWFSEKMKDELLKHLDRPGWQKEKVRYLWDRMKEEMDELGVAMHDNLTRDEIIKECADIANFVMMIADVYRERVKP